MRASASLPWTRRFFDAVVRGCIPGSSDPVAFPFERLLDFRAMTIKLPEQWAHALAHELRAVDESAHMRLQQQLRACGPPLCTRREASAAPHRDDGEAQRLLSQRGLARGAPTRFWSPMRGRFKCEQGRPELGRGRQAASLLELTN